MPVIDVIQDLDQFKLTIVAEFAASPERIWDLYADPRQLEKVWGPPSHPSTFVDHSMVVGSRTTYFMTGLEGEKYCGYWLITEVDKPRGFSFNDGFADENFIPNPNLPESKNEYRFEKVSAGTRATYTGTYASKEGLEMVLSMGVIEGATSAINQIDNFIAH